MRHHKGAVPTGSKASILVPISLLITASLCVLLLAAVVFRRRRPDWRLTQPSEAPRQPRSRPRLGLAVSGIATEEAIMEAAAKRTLAPAGDEAQLAGLCGESEPVDAIPLAEVDAAKAIWIAEVIDAPGWPQPGELEPGRGPADVESGPIGEGQATFEVNSPALAVAGEDDAQDDTSETWTASSDGFDPPSEWDDGASSWTAPDAPPADWGTPTTNPGDSAPVTADETEASWDGTILHDRSRNTGGALGPVDWEAPVTGWDDGLVADTGADESVWEIPTISTDDPIGGEAAGATTVAPEPETGPRVVDLSGGAAGVTAHLRGNGGHPRLDPAVAAAVELAVEAGLSGTQPGVVVVIATDGGQVRSQREERLARTVGKLEAKLQALVRESAPQPSRPSRPPRSSADQPVLRLSAVEEHELRTFVRRRSAPVQARLRARIVLATARGLDVTAISRRVGVHRTTVRRWQQRFAEHRLMAIIGSSDAAPVRQRSR